jgi:hypothetical protein
MSETRSRRQAPGGRSGESLRALLLGLALGLTLLLAGGRAGATPITIGGAGGPAFSVDPIYFKGFGVFGLTGPGTSIDFTASAPVPFLSAASGSGVDLSVSQGLLQPPYQHPQDPANSENPFTNGSVPSNPTAAVPFVADSIWTIHNNTGRALDDVLLLFTKTIAQPGYPAVDVALDDYLYDVIKFTSTDETVRYYGAIPLGDIGIGKDVAIRVRYIVAGALPIFGGQYVMPPLGLAGLEGGHYVPEPETAALLAAGLALLAAARGRR